uniref:Tripartite motif containing 35 n=2 Tax=Anolis carolinensis TaxID=28377 RepID=A0A803SX09_ANOCA
MAFRVPFQLEWNIKLLGRVMESSLEAGWLSVRGRVLIKFSCKTRSDWMAFGVPSLPPSWSILWSSGCPALTERLGSACFPSQVRPLLEPVRAAWLLLLSFFLSFSFFFPSSRAAFSLQSRRSWTYKEGKKEGRKERASRRGEGKRRAAGPMACYFPAAELARSPRRRSARTCCQRCLPSPPSKAMAKEGSMPVGGGTSSAIATMKEELQCPICYEPFKDAATLCCGHNFCKGCVSRSWEGQSRAHVCPVCKAVCAPEDLRTNHTLVNIVEMFLKQEERQQQKKKAEEASCANLCPWHQEEAKLFCLDDKELVCFVCQGAKEHVDHNIRPVAEVAKTRKAESLRLQKEIKKQFQEMREFLRNEERVMLEALQEETQRKQELVDDKIKKLKEESTVLLQEVGQLQADMKDDDVSFLKKHKSRKRRIAWTIEKPEAIPPGTLIEATKYLDSLQYTAWKKMLEIIKVVPFSFDPNTATSCLAVSDDLSSIGACANKLMVEVPERFSTSMPCILGSRSFSGGPHVWEVDVGSKEYWYVGVARKADGYFWSIGCNSHLGSGYMYRMQGTSNKESLSKAVLSDSVSQKDLQRLRVELDCNEAELSFYNAQGGGHIYTFHDKFGEVFPFFYLFATDTSKPLSEPFQICPLQVRIKADYPN